MPSLMLMELQSRYCNGYWYHASDASAALEYYRTQYPSGRWKLFEIRAEPGRPPLESMLPLCSVENARLRQSFGTDGGL